MSSPDSQNEPIRLHFTPTPDQARCLIRTAAEAVFGNAINDSTLSARQIRLSELAYDDLLAQMTDEPPAPTMEALTTDTARLAQEIDDLTVAWAAASDVNTDLGDDIVRAGRRLLHLAAAAAAADWVKEPSRRALEYSAAELAEAISYYSELEEHEATASSDIFGRLTPGITLIQRIIQMPQRPARARRVTVAELIENLRQLPQDHEIWIAVPGDPDGYTPMLGAPCLAHDDAPCDGDPEHFVVLGPAPICSGARDQHQDTRKQGEPNGSA